jgi:hypothetical protein
VSPPMSGWAVEPISEPPQPAGGVGRKQSNESGC